LNSVYQYIYVDIFIFFYSRCLLKFMVMEKEEKNN
jgi:hypothetical protein